MNCDLEIRIARVFVDRWLWFYNFLSIGYHFKLNFPKPAIFGKLSFLWRNIIDLGL